MKEIRILLNESTFTNTCKMGFFQYRSLLVDPQSITRQDIYITKSDMLQIITGNILEKEVDGVIFKIALQDIGLDLIKEIIRRSPMYSDMTNQI